MSSLIKSNRKRDAEVILDHLTLTGDNQPMLNPEQEEKLEAMLRADQLLMKYEQSTVVQMLLTTYPEFSRSTVYRLIRDTREIFNSLNPIDRDFGRRLAIKWAFEAHDLAIKKRDAKALAAAVDRLIKIFGIDKEEDRQIDPEKLEQHNYILQLIVRDPAGKERSQTIHLNDIDDLPKPQLEQVIDDVHENYGFDDIEALTPDDPEE